MAQQILTSGLSWETQDLPKPSDQAFYEDIGQLPTVEVYTPDIQPNVAILIDGEPRTIGRYTDTADQQYYGAVEVFNKTQQRPFTVTYTDDPTNSFCFTSRRIDAIDGLTFSHTPGILNWVELNQDVIEGAENSLPSLAVVILTKPWKTTLSGEHKFAMGILTPAPANADQRYTINYRGIPYILKPERGTGVAIHADPSNPRIIIQDPRHIKGTIVYGVTEYAGTSTVSPYTPIAFGDSLQRRQMRGRRGLNHAAYFDPSQGFEDFSNTYPRSGVTIVNEWHRMGSHGPKDTAYMPYAGPTCPALYLTTLIARAYVDGIPNLREDRFLRLSDQNQILATLTRLGIDPRKPFENPEKLEEVIKALGIWYRVRPGYMQGD